MTLGEKIKTLRKEQNLTLQDLSDRTGLTKESICHYENNKVKPSLVSIQKLATGLNCKFEDLYELL